MSSSNERRNKAFIDKYRKELRSMLDDISKIDRKVLTRSVNAGLKEAKRLTPVGKYSNVVDFYTTTIPPKHVHFKTSETKTKVGGTLKKGWHSPRARRVGNGVEKILENNVDYAIYVNDGHRVVSVIGDTYITVGYVPGKHILEKAGNVAEKAMIQEFNAEIERVKAKHDG
ncbi:HK97 gp10 family phage protein [Caproiciproducens galactitolivorans]|uniref:Phage protein, HK97 gp10 family n=1 Tax=Caproiciproducens galactitolivorans TaxID=642589 RepID=A0A4Z0YCC3_9FIRM|nr:HK97 gp10 family phage protein [Caproiciproducens galactitolivorans]QEY33731.1 HK97 gp10 family phage protein [Caproiciproducens galactitolivorans]TGJ75486.1 hypothetical protein CAGA_23650 [Caproiciproducens galactitolivorans]